MKILVVCQYYYPEPFRISDICEALASQGHEVMVLTGEPNYPEGKRYRGYAHGERTDEVRNGVKIHRCYTVPRGKAVGGRVLNYYSYSLSAQAYIRSGKCIAHDGRPFDIVLVNQLSPIMMSEAGILYKRKYGVPMILYCLDLWPESLVAGKIERKSWIYQYFHRVSRKIYNSADFLLVTSRSFKKYMIRHFSISEEVIEYLPQYAEGLFDELPAKKPNGYTDVMFAGNIGELQGLDTVLEAADILKNDRVRFHIVGGGTDLDRLIRLAKAKGLNHVIFYGRRPLEEMPKMYKMADAMLVTMKADPIISMTLPGKIQSYMACGKAVLGSINGEAANVIRESECGLCAKAGDAEGLAHIVREYIANENRERMGKNARRYYEEHYQREGFLKKLNSFCNTVTCGRCGKTAESMPRSIMPKGH